MKTLAFLFSFFAIIFTPNQNSIDTLQPELEREFKGNKSFARFLSHFERVELPEDFDHAKIQEFKTEYLDAQKKKVSISSTVRKDMTNYIIDPNAYRFSRMGPPMVFPLNRFYVDHKTLAVTYLVRPPYGFTGFNIQMALFDLKGNKKMAFDDRKSQSEYRLAKGEGKKSKNSKLNSITIAGLDISNTTLCFFENPQNLNISNFKNNWQKEVREVGIADNTIANYERLNSQAVTMLPNGEVEVRRFKPSYAGLE